MLIARTLEAECLSDELCSSLSLLSDGKFVFLSHFLLCVFCRLFGLGHKLNMIS